MSQVLPMVVKMSDYNAKNRNYSKKILRINVAMWINKMCSIDTQVDTYYYQW
jgi:hypothetical protein